MTDPRIIDIHLDERSIVKRNADIEIRVVMIPEDWSPPVAGVFVKETMNDLVDIGERMGADPASWSDDIRLRV